MKGKKLLSLSLSAVLAFTGVVVPEGISAGEVPSRQTEQANGQTTETLNADKGVDKTLTADGVEYPYTVLLPQGYDGNDTQTQYPVLYLMPEDGKNGYSEAFLKSVEKELAGDTIQDVIVVKTDFSASGAKVYEAVKKMIEQVDAEYHTVADPSGRGVIGADDGGYLATILTYTDGAKNWISQPDLFGMMASIGGDYVSKDNAWIAEYGDFYGIATNNGEGDGNLSNQIANSFYTYMDSASEDAKSSAQHGCNDIISYYINRGAAYGGFYYSYYGNADSYALKLEVKNASYDESFLEESVAEAIDGIGSRLLKNMLQASLTLSPQAAYATQQEITAGYKVTVSDLYTAYRGAKESPLTLTISMTDSDTGEKVAEDQSFTINVKENAQGYVNETPVKLPNVINRISTTVTLTAEILGKEVELDSKPLVRIAATGEAPEEQLIDLLGSWHFKATEEVTAGELPKAEDYLTWEEVYPCLGWWDETLSKVTNMKNYVGYGWYIKEFTIPEDFPQGEYIVPVGYFDETDVCFINGRQIGCTGLNADTWQHEKDCWDTERIYSVRSEDLNIGGKNVMMVLSHNQSGDGGWYAGHPGLYSTAAYNKLTSRPSVFASEENAALVKATVAEQAAAIEAKDLSAYAATVDPGYFQSGSTKEALLQKISALTILEEKTGFEDREVNVFEADGLYYYQAERTYRIGDKTKQESVKEYYRIENGKAVLYGEHDRFFAQQIPSAHRALALESGNQTETENFLIYLPEGYFAKENEDRFYPTAYVFHQLNSSSNSYAVDGLDQLMDAGMAEGKIKDTILVIPDSNDNGFWQGEWEKMVTEEILPFVDEHYRTIRDARYRFTAGASMGGSGSYLIGLNHPELFSGIISYFGAINMGGKPLDKALQASDTFLRYYRQYFVSGNRDLYKFGIPAIALDKKLRSAGVEHFFELEEGGHDSSFYLPYVIDSFADQTQAQPVITGEQAEDVFSGQVTWKEEDGICKITYQWKATDKIRDFRNQVPAADKEDTVAADVIVPVTVRVEQNGKTVYHTIRTYAVSEQTEKEETITADSMDLNPKEAYSIIVSATLGNETVCLARAEKKKAEETPGTPVVVTTPKTGGNVAPARTVPVRPKTTKIKELKSASGVVTVKWKKQTTQTDGYEIQFAKNKNFTKGVKTKKAAAKKGSMTVKGLKKGVNYYVRIRTYKKENGKKIYSEWSKRKKVKVK